MRYLLILILATALGVCAVLSTGCAYVPRQEFANYAYREAHHTYLLTEATFALYENRPLTDLVRRDIIVRKTVQLPNGGFQVHLASPRYRILAYVDKDNIIRDINVREERAAIRGAGPSRAGIDPDMRAIRPPRRRTTSETGW